MQIMLNRNRYRIISHENNRFITLKMLNYAKHCIIYINNQSLILLK